MLDPMQQSTEVAPSPISSSFACLLAALASPASGAPNGSGEADRARAYSSDGLGDDLCNGPGGDLGEDVAILSYERALRAHARYKPAGRADWLLPAATGPRPGDVRETLPDAAPAGQGPRAQAEAGAQSALERDLRSASITVRLTGAECAQLHRRAAEAGLTVSAYLRSCTLEAEALRAQVKEALAALRTAASQEKRGATVKQRRSWFGWLVRLLPHRHVRQQIAAA
jgi:hypothetical protein